MATGYIPLDLGAALLPDNSTNNAPCGMVVAKSSAAAPTPIFTQLLFDAGTQEWAYFSFQMPGDYASAPVLELIFKMASATSGNVIFASIIAAQTGGDSADVDAIAGDTVNTSSGVAVAGTAGYPTRTTLALTNADSLAANDFIVLGVSRDADNGSDTATGDLELIAASLSYTTT